MNVSSVFPLPAFRAASRCCGISRTLFGLFVRDPGRRSATAINAARGLSTTTIDDGGKLGKFVHWRGRMDKLLEQANARIGKTKQRRCRSYRRVTVHIFLHEAHAGAADEFYWRCDVCGPA
jgi:hypothetical protein